MKIIEQEDMLEEELVVIHLDTSIFSPLLKSTTDNQSKLLKHWCMEADLFKYSIITPLEYCIEQPNLNGQYCKISKAPYVYSKKLPLEEEGSKWIWGMDSIFVPDYVGSKHGSLLSVKQSTNNDEIICEKETERSDATIPVVVEMRNNREFMMESVQKNGLLLYYAHPDLLFDQELLLEAIRNNVSAFQYVPYNLRRDEQFLKRAIEKCGDVFLYLTGEWRKRNDLYEISLRTCENKLKLFERLDPSIRMNYAPSMVSNYWRAIYFLNPSDSRYSQLIQIILNSNQVSDSELINSNLITNRKDLWKYLDISYRALILAKRECIDNEAIIKALRSNMIISNYLSYYQWNAIKENHSLIMEIIQNPIELTIEAATFIIKNSNRDNVRALVKRYPFLAEKVTEVKMMFDPYILRYLPSNKQYETIRKCAKLIMDEKEYFETVGYYFQGSSALAWILRERFTISHPGLVIPYHRFGKKLDCQPICWDFELWYESIN
ncbi:predicted protein [Naegleria gruberi]|uniref:Predicted protein n=1 Tax=Naegleria gruberi TaxID=5762 RepID=D2VVM4_NAEGR|nr:uncharacterized protein NAEGRDRAFT_52617 [Naegleria gruberi]EFC39067.1 predicted protein [Naegleria gruberi]|eukprot:XP_002671811.1 predicted protein [Naegleria gruberi strain NEG-M]